MIRRLLLVSILVFSGLLGLGIFGYRSIRMHEDGLEGRRFAEFTAVAGQIRTEVRRSLNDFLSVEQVRPYTDYQYLFVPQATNDINAMVRSPLGDELSHGLAYGYFQINPDSTLTTPHDPAESGQSAASPVREYLAQLKPLLTRLGEPGRPLAPALAMVDKITAEPLTKTATKDNSYEQPLTNVKGKQIMDRSGKFAVIEPEQQKAVTVTQSRANVEQNIFRNSPGQMEEAQQTVNPSQDSSYSYQQRQRSGSQPRQQSQSSTRRQTDSGMMGPQTSAPSGRDALSMELDRRMQADELNKAAQPQTAPAAPQPAQTRSRLPGSSQANRTQSATPQGDTQRQAQTPSQVPAMAQAPQQNQTVQTTDSDRVLLQMQQQPMDSQQVLMQPNPESQMKQTGTQQGQSAGSQQPQQDLVQVRIEPIVPIWVSDPKSDLPFNGQVYFLRHVQFEQTHLMQGFRLDQANLLAMVEDAADRLLRRGMGYSLNPADSDTAAYTAFLDFGFGELPLNLLEMDPGWIARDMGRLRGIYAIIFGVVFGATVAALVGLGKALTAQIRLSRKKDDFLSAVSHELRTPLTTIRMYTEMLEKDWVRSESKRNEYYGIMRQESERLTRLIENVLDFSRIQRGRKQFVFAAGDFNRIVGDVIEMMTPCAQRAGFAIQRDLQYVEPFCFDSDAVMQIVINLLDNAIKYARDAEDKTIFVRTKTDGKIVQIEVEDRGPGIPRNERTKIFDEFYRIGDESRRETTGTGLGLALVKRFAEAHHGGVAVFAANPRGALFRVGLAVRA